MAALVFLAAILIIQGKYTVKTHALDSVIMRRYAKKIARFAETLRQPLRGALQD